MIINIERSEEVIVYSKLIDYCKLFFILLKTLIILRHIYIRIFSKYSEYLDLEQ